MPSKLNKKSEPSQEKKNVPILFGFTQAISNFVSTSTLLESKLIYVSVLAGFFIAIVTGYTFYSHEKEKKCWNRSVLVFLEAVGIFCIAYDAIYALHKNTPPSLPAPLNDYDIRTKARIGLFLIGITLFFLIVMIYLENHTSSLDSKKELTRREENMIRAKQWIIAGLVFVGTYPLMINFFVGLHHGVCTDYLIALAVSVALCSCTAQAFFINQHEEKTASKKEWFGKFFMILEIILSLANTAFSNHKSSFGECLHLLQNDWIDKHTQSIGFILFIASIIALVMVTYQHFKPLCDSQNRTLMYFC